MFTPLNSRSATRACEVNDDALDRTKGIAHRLGVGGAICVNTKVGGGRDRSTATGATSVQEL